VKSIVEEVKADAAKDAAEVAEAQKETTEVVAAAADAVAKTEGKFLLQMFRLARETDLEF
jgi:hypothetical protein